MSESNEELRDTNQRVGPLNLTDEEVSYLWKMMKREVGKQSVQYSDDRAVVESLHTKVRSACVMSEGGDGE